MKMSLIYIMVNEISFSYQKMSTKTRFEEEAKGNSEMAYSHVFNQSRHKPNLESTSKYGFSLDLGGKNSERSEHAHASYPGLCFRPPGFSPYSGGGGRKESSGTGLLIIACKVCSIWNFPSQEKLKLTADNQSILYLKRSEEAKLLFSLS